MSLAWSVYIAVVVLAFGVFVHGASIGDKTVVRCKKTVRHGDELFLADAEGDDCDNYQDDLGNDLHKRSTDDLQGHRRVVRDGHELVTDDDDDGDDNSHAQNRLRRSAGGEHREVIKVGDQLIVLKDDNDNDDNTDDDNDENDDDDHHKGNGIHRRAAIKDESYRWHDKTVPYLFDHTFGPRDQATVRSAMEEWSKHTCIQFRPARSTDINKVKFIQGDGCFSFVGMVEKTQTISLDSDGCRYLSTALHEIGHALGMYHTQVRPDRDQYVSIDLSDVEKKLRDNFEKQTWKSAHHYGVDYDFNSIMHYDGNSFTSSGGTSIKTLDPKWQKVIGNAKHLSFGDIEMMNKMYHCTPKTCGLKDADCPGTSFVNKACQCVCPGPSKDIPVVPCSATGKGSGKSNNNNNNNNKGNQPKTEVTLPSDWDEWTYGDDDNQDGDWEGDWRVEDGGWHGDDGDWHGDDTGWHGDDGGWHGDDGGWHGDDGGWHGDDDDDQDWDDDSN